jgi:hypothetical protein
VFELKPAEVCGSFISGTNLLEDATYNQKVVFRQIPVTQLTGTASTIELYSEGLHHVIFRGACFRDGLEEDLSTIKIEGAWEIRHGITSDGYCLSVRGWKSFRGDSSKLKFMSARTREYPSSLGSDYEFSLSVKWSGVVLYKPFFM